MKNTELNVKLNQIEAVKTFINKVSKYDFDIMAGSGRYIVDGKSIMGLFSLNLANPVSLTIISDTEEEVEAFKREINSLICK